MLVFFPSDDFFSSLSFLFYWFLLGLFFPRWNRDVKCTAENDCMTFWVIQITEYTNVCLDFCLVRSGLHKHFDLKPILKKKDWEIHICNTLHILCLEVLFHVFQCLINGQQAHFFPKFYEPCATLYRLFRTMIYLKT